MNNHTPNTVGIDISKAYLDAYELPSREHPLKNKIRQHGYC